MTATNTLQQLKLKYETDEWLKYAVYDGFDVTLPVVNGSVTFQGVTLFVSRNLADESLLVATVIVRKSGTTYLVAHDIVKFGKQDLLCLPYKTRIEFLDVLCLSSNSLERECAILGGRCVSQDFFIVAPVQLKMVVTCEDSAIIGVRAVNILSSGTSEEDVQTILRDDVEDEDHCDSVALFPPVENEAERAYKYKDMIYSMIKKMTGKWRDANQRRHAPSLLPFDSDDLFQQGLMLTIIAIRKYDKDNEWKAQESTFVYRHLYNRFGQIAHKYSKASKGYGVTIVRDFINDEGQLISAFDRFDGNQDD